MSLLSIGLRMLKRSNFLLPSTCILCSTYTTRSIALCPDCEADLPWLTSVSTTLFHYQPPIDNFIMALKFHQQLIYARLFGELLSIRLQQHYQHQALPEVIVPVPLHIKRLRERGFNQALEIARPVAKRLKLPVDVNSCERVRLTVAQSSLPANERQDNVKNAFKITRALTAKHVAIIDDVITTGYTVAELSKTLNEAGVERIDVWSIARTDLK